MATKQSASDKLGVLTIGFSPVVREGLQAIMIKDERIKVIGDAEVRSRLHEDKIRNGLQTNNR